MPSTVIQGTGYFCRAYTRTDDGIIAAYYNGEFDGSAEQSVTATNDYICIGKYLNGVVKAHLVYNTQLTGEKIKQAYTYLASQYSYTLPIII